MNNLFKYWKPLLLIGAFVLIAILAHTDGKLGERKKWEAKEAAYQQALAEKKVEQAEKNVEVVTKYVDRVQVVKEKGQIIYREVPVYVEKDSNTMLSGGFRVFHDATASNELPDSTRIADAPPVTAQDVAETVSENYQRCHENTEQLKALQEWVKSQR